MTSESENTKYQDLAVRHGYPHSKYLPMIFKRMVSEQQADILLQFPARTKEIAENLKIDSAVIESELQELFEKGVAFPTSKGWRLGRIIDSVHDLTLSNTKYWNAYGGVEYAHLWRAFETLEWIPKLTSHLMSMEAPLMRVVPAWQAVKENPDLMPEEDIREIYAHTDAIVLIPCPCRREHYDRSCGSPDEMCISLNRSAQYNLKRGVGRLLSPEEAVEFEDTVRKHDAITIVPNSPIIDMVICHCHGCCCLSFHAFRQMNIPVHQFAAKSRYEAGVDPEKCIACQKCVETCQVDAMEMKKYDGITKWKAYVDPEKCVGCGNCVLKCPKDALEFKLVRPPEHIPRDPIDVYAYGDAKK